MADGAPLIFGQTDSGNAVEGNSTDDNAAGVAGFSTNNVGVYGQSGLGREGTGIGVFGQADSDYGVVGAANGGFGVFGFGSGRGQGINGGVVGRSDDSQNVGVSGISLNGVGVYGVSDTGYAGVFRGLGHFTDDVEFGGLIFSRSSKGMSISGESSFSDSVIVGGALSVYGAKSAVVRFPDRSHRSLYSLESPESWFEDFGRARLARGRARVKLDPLFAAVVLTDDYHVFLSPEGTSKGLYVSRRNRAGFEVREQEGGASTLPFSYRVVARRKDIKVQRFEKVKLPPRRKFEEMRKMKVPRLIELPKLPRRLESPKQIQPRLSGLPKAPRSHTAK